LSGSNGYIDECSEDYIKPEIEIDWPHEAKCW
jgi:hypothetical protein